MCAALGLQAADGGHDLAWLDVTKRDAYESIAAKVRGIAAP